MQQGNSKVRETTIVVTASKLRLAPVVLLCALAAGCGGGASSTALDSTPVVQIVPSVPSNSNPPPQATPTLGYAARAVLTVGISVPTAPNTAPYFLPGKISVSPALPTGLGFDSSTGGLIGTPTELSPARDYEVSDAAAPGITYKLTLEVTSGPLFYPSPASLQLGSPMKPLTPTGTDFLTAFSVSPALPDGLSIDPATGIISGTPTRLSPPAYYRISGVDSEFNRDYGLTLGVGDPTASTASTAGFECAHSGGFIGTFEPDSTSASYGLIAIAFTPDGHAHARVQDLSINETVDSDGQEGLSLAFDGSFSINFPTMNDSMHPVIINGTFTGIDAIAGTLQVGAVARPFVALRLGGSSAATYRYTSGFGGIDNYRIDFGTVDVTGSTLSGVGYQMNYYDADSVLTNRELFFGATISNGKFQVSVDDFTGQFDYTVGQPALNLGDPEDGLLFLETEGCQLN
jgi:putative Ig domain-containing protein